MKGHKAHHHGKKHGGEVGEHLSGVAEYKQDLASKPMSYTAHDKVGSEAAAKKHGGRAKRKHGGHVMHHHSGHVKHVGAVHGAAAKHHAGRKPRKAGGKVGSDSNPLSSAHKGTEPRGHKDMDID